PRSASRVGSCPCLLPFGIVVVVVVLSVFFLVVVVVHLVVAFRVEIVLRLVVVQFVLDLFVVIVFVVGSTQLLLLRPLLCLVAQLRGLPAKPDAREPAERRDAEVERSEWTLDRRRRLGRHALTGADTRIVVPERDEQQRDPLVVEAHAPARRRGGVHVAAC